MSDFDLTIDGKAVAGASRFGVINPATGEVFAQAPDCSRAQLDAAMDVVAGARSAPWQADIEQRRKALRACAEAIKAQAAELAPILTQEQGKPLPRRMRRGDRRGGLVRVHRGPADPGRGRRRTTPENRIEVRRRPLGVVARDHALELPAAARRVEDRAGAARRQHGRAQAVAVHAAHHAEARRGAARRAAARRAERGLGRRRARRLDDRAPGAAQDLVHRLGRDRQEGRGRRRAGPEAHHARARRQRPRDRARRRRPEAVAEKLFWGAFQNCGQVCSAIKRVYVPREALRRRSSSALAELAKAREGRRRLRRRRRSSARSTTSRSSSACSELVEDAKKAGARIVAGGAPVGGKRLLLSSRPS